MFKKFLATATVVAMMTGSFGMTAFAADWGTEGGSTDVEGSNYAVNPVIEVELPGSLEFGVNPLYLDADGDDQTTEGQIVSGDYCIINYSNVAVLISSSTVVTAKDDVSLLTDADWNTTTNEIKPVTSKKAVWLTMMFPQVAVAEDAPKLTPLTFTKGTSKNANIVGYTLGASATEVKFALSAYGTELKPENIGAFQFGGAVDPNAVFVEEDLSVKTTFTLNTLTADQKTNSWATLQINSADVTTSGATGCTAVQAK